MGIRKHPKAEISQLEHGPKIEEQVARKEEKEKRLDVRG